MYDIDKFTQTAQRLEKERLAKIKKEKRENNFNLFATATGAFGMVLLGFGNDIGLLYLIPAFVSLVRIKQGEG